LQPSLSHLLLLLPHPTGLLLPTADLDGGGEQRSGRAAAMASFKVTRISEGLVKPASATPKETLGKVDAFLY
jgi:hypothetical protein